MTGRGAAADNAAGKKAPGNEAVPDRPYAGVCDNGTPSGVTHVLERKIGSDAFTGYAVCGATADGWVWSPSNHVSCPSCTEAGRIDVLRAGDLGDVRHGTGSTERIGTKEGAAAAADGAPAAATAPDAEAGTTGRLGGRGGGGRGGRGGGGGGRGAVCESCGAYGASLYISCAFAPFLCDRCQGEPAAAAEGGAE